MKGSLKKTLPHDITLIGFHSATTAKENQYLWQQLLDKKPVVIIGVHLPVLMPISNLGIIIIDEEHEQGYQEKKHPKINSKEAALIRAKIADIPILLGSATPSLSSLYNVKKRGWSFFQLTKRFSGNFPTISTVLLSNKQRRKSFWITAELEKEIAQRLAKKRTSNYFYQSAWYKFFYSM